MRVFADLTHVTGLLLLISQQIAGQTEQSEVDTVINILKKASGFETLDPSISPSYSNAFTMDVQPQVQTTSGLIYGAKSQYANSFFGIPFAVPPVDDFRFRPPEKLVTPELSRNLSERFTIECAQPLGGQLDEDCLVLTVHVPSSVDLSDSDDTPPTDQLLPVMLFIPGGAFFIGAGTYATYDGRFLSQITSSIIVTMNYRLGPLGFMVFDDGENIIEGNQGLRDQQLALQWVKDNIKNFGGDDSRVTLFGESAGAQSTMFHLVSEISEPLFHRAIMESNPAAYWYPNRDQALMQTDRLVESLRCGITNRNDCCRSVKSNYSCLMEASTEALISAMVRIQGLDVTRLNMLNVVEPFRPYIDGDEFPDHPMSLFKKGKWNTNKPFIIGTNAEELVIFKYFLPMNENVFRVLNRRLFDGQGNTNNTGDIISEKYIELYGSTISDYSHIFGIQMTDIIFGCSSRALARLASETTHSDVYYYIFDHSLDGPDCQDYMGNFCEHSFHGSELYFVFRTIDHVGMNSDEEDILVQNQFSTYWGNMAWTGNPSEGPDFNLEGDFPRWTRYAKEPEDESWRNMRIANANAYLEANYLKDVCDFWDSLELYEVPAVDLAEVTTTAPIALPTTSRGTVVSISVIPFGISIILLLVRATAGLLV